MEADQIVEDTGVVNAGGEIVDRIRTVGDDLGRSIGSVLLALPPAARRPNGLAQELGLNRAVASKVLNATRRKDPLEIVHLIPGPEPLRHLVRAAAEKDIAPELVEAAEDAISRFDALIRQEAGTRSALDAMISSSLPGARERFELASKYSVFKGISQLKGVRAETWLGTAIITPSEADPERHDVTWLNGAVAMQRLRPGVTIRFGYRHDKSLGRSPQEHETAPELATLDQFCTNPPAQLVARTSGDVVNYLLPPDLLGPKSVTDMFAVDHHPAAMRRYAESEVRRRSSVFVEPAVPVEQIVYDVLLHEDAFRGAQPRLDIYDTGYDGIANVNDPTRDIDRMDLTESIEVLGQDMRRVYTQEIPTYGAILEHMAAEYGWDLSRYRGYRTRIQYPVYGWQICMSFERPEVNGS